MRSQLLLRRENSRDILLHTWCVNRDRVLRGADSVDVDKQRPADYQLSNWRTIGRIRNGSRLLLRKF